MYGRCTVVSGMLRGVHVDPVYVEVAISSGIPLFSIVGMGDTAIQESRERVRAALKSSGFDMPQARCVVNLAPSALKKSGTGFDVAIALAIMVITGQAPPTVVQGRLFVGELSLEGFVRPVNGLLAFGLTARELGLELVCAREGSQTVDIAQLSQVGIGTLRDLVTGNFTPLTPERFNTGEPQLDFRDIGGNEVAKRALQIAATGQHGILMMGPPGSGKTMLASRLPSILPDLSEQEALESALIHSVAGLDISSILSGIRPFRAPHHSASSAGLIGGGTPVRPGEISLAHNGVLMLDEFAEFKPAVLQGMRQPMETGSVVVTRADGSITFPARFMLVGASNPCACGYLGDRERPCTCTQAQIHGYRNRIGGPLLDRIDMHIDVARVPPERIMDAGSGTSSEQLKAGVLAGREYASWRKARHPVEPSTAGVISSCKLEDEDLRFFEKACRANKMSGRAMVRTLGVARTIADIAQRESVTKGDLCEALTYRPHEVGSS